MTSGELAPLYAIHRTAWREVARRAGAREDADDAVHDACVAALAGALPLAGESDDAMVRRLVRTYANTYRVREVRRNGRPFRWGQLPPHDMLAALEQRITVQRAVDTLPAAYHIAPTFVWEAVQGATLQELQDPQGLKLKRAWEHLRPLLAPWREGRVHKGRWAEGCGEAGCQR